MGDGDLGGGDDGLGGDEGSEDIPPNGVSFHVGESTRGVAACPNLGKIQCLGGGSSMGEMARMGCSLFGSCGGGREGNPTYVG